VTRLAWVLFAGVLAAIAGVIVSGFAPCGGDGRLARLPVSPALTVPVALRGCGAGHAARHLLLLGLLQHCLSRRRGAAAGADHSTRHFCFRCSSWQRFYVTMNLAALPSMRDAAAQVAVGAFGAAGNWWRTSRQSAFGSMAGAFDGRADRVDRPCFGLLAPAGLLARALRRRTPMATTSAFWLRCIHGMAFPPIVGGSGTCGGGFSFLRLDQVITMLVITRILLQFFLQHAGRDAAAGAEARVAAPRSGCRFYPHAAFGCNGGVFLMLVQPEPRAGGLAVAAGIAAFGDIDLHLSRLGGCGNGHFLRPRELTRHFEGSSPLQNSQGKSCNALPLSRV